MSAPDKPDTPGKGLARSLDLDLDDIESALAGVIDIPAPPEMRGAGVSNGSGEGAEEIGEGGERPTLVAPPLPMRPPQSTLTNEVELEEARKKSQARGDSSLPPSRAVTAPPAAGTIGAAVSGRVPFDLPILEPEEESEPKTRISAPHASLLQLADARIASIPPTAERPLNAWTNAERTWNEPARAADDEATTNQSPLVVSSATTTSSGMPASPTPPDDSMMGDANEASGGDGAADATGASGLPASGHTKTTPPSSPRSATLRPGAAASTPPPPHNPAPNRRATRVWTSATASTTHSVPPPAPSFAPAAPPEADASPVVPASSSSSSSARVPRVPGVSNAASRAPVESSVAPSGERAPKVAAVLASERETPHPSALEVPFTEEVHARPAVARSTSPTRAAGVPRATPAAVARDRAEQRGGKSSLPPPTRRASTDPTQEMRERFTLGDYTGALTIAEGILEGSPHSPDAQEYADSCRSVLQQMYTARIGPLDRVPVVMVARDQLRWLSIDHRAGFVLSHVDGISSLEMILDVSGMPVLDTLRILCELHQQRIIAFR